MTDTLSLLRRQARLAYDTDDLDTLATMLLDGIAFARATIQTETSIAEADFAAWRRAGRPSFFPGRRILVTDCNRTLAEAVSLVADRDLVASLYAVAQSEPVGVAERRLASSLYGIGIPKAHFALACAGFGRGGCIDTILADRHHDTLAGLGVRFRADGHTIDWPKASNRAWRLYALALATLWPGDDSARGQWREWLAILAEQGRTTQHSVLL